MTTEEQFKACAKLDNPKLHEFKCSDPWDGDCDICGGKAPSKLHDIPNYSSRDVLVLLIEKQSCSKSNKFEYAFIQCLCETVLGMDSCSSRKSYTEIYHLLIRIPPSQLREALLRATGKWKK